MDQVSVLVVCTGNVARSVMAGYMLEHLAGARGMPLDVATAGTLAVGGQPMGARTLEAMRTIPALDGVPAGAHRSRQLAERDIERADLVVVMESDHVRYVRRHHPSAASRTATIRRLARDLEPGPSALSGLADRLATLRLGEVAISGSGHHDALEDEDVADPAGKDDSAYAACAAELWTLCCALVERL